MGRARRARRIAATAAFGGGIAGAGLGALGLGAWGLLRGEALVARRAVGHPFDDEPDDNGTYGAGPGDPLQLLIIGDSLAKGLGVDDPKQTLGATIATAVAALTGRPVTVTNVAAVGAASSALGEQVERGLEKAPHPDVAIIVIGANDITGRVPRSAAVRHLSAAVFTLREAGAEVVVGTCPDMGAIEPVPQPLRLLARRWSRDLAAAQTVAVIEQGGRTVSIGDLLGPEFQQTPRVMFSVDRFHPSAAGYARATAVLLPSVLDALGHDSPDTGRKPDLRRGEGIGPVSIAATRAVRDPGTEVSGTAYEGDERGRQGRWAMLLRRHHAAIPRDEADRAEDDDVTGDEAAATADDQS